MPAPFPTDPRRESDAINATTNEDPIGVAPRRARPMDFDAVNATTPDVPVGRAPMSSSSAEVINPTGGERVH